MESAGIESTATVNVPGGLAHAARTGNVVVLAGAGVSAAPPTSLPSWYQMHEMIADSLASRIAAETGTGLGGHSLVGDAITRISATRSLGGFPPEYQAGLIEEMCGPRYFEALTALDVSTGNTGHAAVAALAKAGVLRAVVTTNFDRLIEQALDSAGVAYRALFDEAGFRQAAASVAASGGAPLPVLKVHGCVSNPPSLVDTLKQRRLGRSAALTAALHPLFEHYWVFAGFSAADLEGDPDYLGFVPNAPRASGATYLRWAGELRTGDAPLRPGAAALMRAYGDRGEVIIGSLTDLAEPLLAKIGAAPISPLPEVEGQIRPTKVEVLENLQAWATALPLPLAVLCLAAVLEGSNEGEAAARVLDTYVRKELGYVPPAERTEQHQLCQFHYGRLGVAWGRYTRVPDLNGRISNATAASNNSLLSLASGGLGDDARSLLGLSEAWAGNARNAIELADRVLTALGGRDPASEPERWFDTWFASAQTLTVVAPASHGMFVADSALFAASVAMDAGDPVRAARAHALCLLVLADQPIDLRQTISFNAEAFSEALRVGDGLALGIQHLAFGRSLAGPNGRREAAAGREAALSVFNAGLACLDEASMWFQRRAFDAWMPFVLVQRARLLADLLSFGQANDEEIDDLLRRAVDMLDRFPCWEPHVLETRAMLAHQGAPHGDWRGLLAHAIQRSLEMGMADKAEQLNGLRILMGGSA